MTDHQPFDDREPAARGKHRGRLLAWAWHGAVLLLVAWLAWRYIDLPLIGRVLLATPANLALLVVAILLVDRTLMAWKWRQLLAVVGLAVPFRAVWLAYYQASFLSRIVPVALGADVLRGHLVVQRTGRWDRVVGSMLVEKILGVLGAVTFASAGAIFLAGTLAEQNFFYFVWAIPAIGAAVVVVLLVTLSGQFGDRFIRLLPGTQFRRLAERLHAAYALYQGHRRALVVNYGLVLVEQAMQLLILYVCARAVGIATAPLVLLAVLALVEFLRKIAIVLEGWGLAQITIVLTCSLAGIDESLALSMALVGHVLEVVATSPAALLLISSKRPQREASQATAERFTNECSAVSSGQAR